MKALAAIVAGLVQAGVNPLAPGNLKIPMPSIREACARGTSNTRAVGKRQLRRIKVSEQQRAQRRIECAIRVAKKTRPPVRDRYAELHGKLTNWQRNQWNRAGRPGMKHTMGGWVMVDEAPLIRYAGLVRG